jgi:hypothetical protein
MDKELEHEKAAIDALITEFNEQMDRVNDLQREIGDRLRAFSKAAPQQGASGEAATEELQYKARRAISRILRLATRGDPRGPA